jgi:hypothetical protein
MSNLSLSFSTSAFVITLFILIAVAISIFFYRRTLPPIPPAKRIVLIALRSLALSLMLMLLFEPLLSLISRSTQQPVLAVLIDNSKSMSIKDKTGDRAAHVKELLKSSAVKNAESIGEVRYVLFGAKTKEQSSINPDSLALNEDATDITSALRQLAREKDRANIGAALIVSDGNYNVGQSPLYEAEQVGIPLYAVGIGDSTEQKDIVVTKVATNELVYAETEVPVDATIKSSGFKGEKIEVTLNEGSRELSKAYVTLEEGTREYGVRLSYVPEGDGVKKYSVRVSRVQGELTTANNQKSFLTRILKSKLRVLMIAGAPSPDLTIVKQTLREDRNIEVRSLTQKTPSAFYEGQLSGRLLDSADCVALIGFPVASTADATIEALKSAMTKKTIPMLFVAGKSVSDSKLSALNSLLPFTTTNTSQTEQLVFLEPIHSTHPILATNTEEGIESWKRMPPIFKVQTHYKAKPEATTLAGTKINNIVVDEPLVVARNVNRQKSLAIVGYGIWRWRLMAQGNPYTERLLSTFLSNAIRWLTTRDDNRPVKVVPTKSQFTQGELIEFAAQVYDASANPIENAQLKVTAKGGGGEFETTLRSIGNGRYEGTMDGVPEGDYTFRAAASLDGQTLGEDKGRFTVGELNLEFQDTRMNVQLLRQLAARSGGRYFSPTEISALPEALRSQQSFAPREIQRAQSFELWNWKYMLAFVVLLLAIEWFVRKRNGML